MGVKLEILISLAVLAPAVASTPASETKTTVAESDQFHRHRRRTTAKAPISTGVATEFSVGNFHTSREGLSATDVTLNVLGIDYLSSNNAVIDTGSMTLFLHH